ncbi:MAG: hypothetical protein ACHQJ7_10170 [Vicinamibacteria bacterium]|jgi:hypothetical protein
MRRHHALALAACLAVATSATAQQAKGTLEANGKSAALTHAIAVEVDSATEKGFLDVVVVVSDRPVTASEAKDAARLEARVRRDGLAALRVVVNPDAKVMSAEPLHPAFTTFVSSALWVRFVPSAYDEKRVAGRFHTPGKQNEFKQQWSYDVTFSAPIALDPAAKTVPK